MNYDVAVVGGGVIGSAAAYYLAKKGKRVLLLDKGTLITESSRAAAGMLAAQTELTSGADALFEMAKVSRAMFPRVSEELKELSGLDIGYRRNGILKVVLDEKEAREFQQAGRRQKEKGEAVEWLCAKEVRQLEPRVSGAVAGALYFPNDSQVDAPALGMAWAKSAQALGAEIKEHAEVRAVLTENGEVRGLKTLEETVHCDQVIVASGVWSSFLLRPLGFKLPVYPVKGECFSVRHEPSVLARTIFSEGCYLVPKGGGRIIVGATMQSHTFDKRVSIRGLKALLIKAETLVPSIADAEWETAWSGLRPQTEDGFPYLGEIPNCRGLFVAAGHFRNGILLSPLTGYLLAEWLDQGAEKAMEKAGVDVAPIDVRRLHSRAETNV